MADLGSSPSPSGAKYSGDRTTDSQAAIEASCYPPGVSFTRVVIDKAGRSVDSCVTAPTFYAATFSGLRRMRLAPKPKSRPKHHKTNPRKESS